MKRIKTNYPLPLISIVTPSLNQADFLGEALASVRTQVYPATEHLVLDGGSTDGSSSILREAASTNPHRLHWRSHPDSGQSAALNEGFLLAKGEIIGWLNADDRYRPDCLDHVAQIFARQPEIDVLYGDYTFIDPVGKHLALRREIEFNPFILKYCHTLYIPTTATFFRRRIFDEGHLLREDLHYVMDLEFFLRLSQAGYRFQHLSRVLADFRIHPAGKSTRFLSQQREEHSRVVLQASSIAQYIPSIYARKLALSLLKIPADGLRYAEKLCKGFYFQQHKPLDSQAPVGAGSNHP